jgi:phosphoglycolate phosphatase-like HAD superfamily hydrolase
MSRLHAQADNIIPLSPNPCLLACTHASIPFSKMKAQAHTHNISNSSSHTINFLLSLLIISSIDIAVAFAHRPFLHRHTAATTNQARLAMTNLRTDLEVHQTINEKPRNLTKVKAVIFDVDGTLADSWRLGYDATRVILDKHNIDMITEEIYHECTRYATPERLARHAGYLPGDDKFESTGKLLAQEFDDLYVSLVTVETAGFFPNIRSMIDQIPPHVALGALTNAAVRYAHAVLQTNDGPDGSLYKRFTSIRGADNVPAAKPDPAGLYEVCKDLGVSPADCVYIGDSPTDALAAHAAGMPSIGVAWGSHGEESLQKAPFDCICRSVEDLMALLPR